MVLDLIFIKHSSYIFQKKKKDRKSILYNNTFSREKKEEMVQSVIVDRRFCVPGPVDLVMVRDKIASQYGNFVIGDVNGNMMFQVKKPGFGLHKKMILLDSSGSPVLTMKEKSMTLHNRWQVFKGGSTEECDMLYTVKRSSMIQRTTKLEVFLGQNNEEKTCDFRVKGTNWLERSCVVYAGVSDVIVAQVNSLTLFPFLFFFFHIDHSGGPSLYRINQLVYALTCLRVNSIFLHPVLIQNWFSTVIYMLLGSILVCFEINFSILVMFGLSRINICLAYM